MRVEIIQGGRALRTYFHNGQTYAEAPITGEYEIRLTNDHFSRRLAVVSVDGVNVVDAKDAGMDGSGYVLNPWQTTSIKGFLRSNAECAQFTFAEDAGSYAAQTGRGTRNTGVIGVAVFEEHVRPVVPPPIVIHKHYHYPPWHHPWENDIVRNSLGGSMGFRTTTVSCNSQENKQFFCDESSSPNLGTAYGRAEAFHTQTTSFVRASATPSSIVTLRYGTAAKLREWGVPVDVQGTPNPFPASPGFAPPPPGWRG